MGARKNTRVGLLTSIVTMSLLLLATLANSGSGALASQPVGQTAGPTPSAGQAQGTGSKQAPPLIARATNPGLGATAPEIQVAKPSAPYLVLHDQYNNDSGNGIPSAIFSNSPQYNAEAADDFVVPAGIEWTINEVDIRSYIGLPSPSGFTLHIYASSGILPGTPVYTATNVIPVGNPDFVFTLPTPVTLGPGTYWVSVQAHTDTLHVWYWEMRTVVSNNQAAWREAGAFNTNCLNWANRAACTATAASPDQMFRLIGTSGPASTSTPTATVTLTPTATATACANYTVATATGTVVPGTTLVPGSNCDDCMAAVPLQFPVTFYGVLYNSASVGANGNLQFTTTDTTFANTCLPASGFGPSIFPYWDDLYTGDGASGQGIFTSVSGVAPNRIFNIEWRAQFCCSSGVPLVDFEIRLYEGQNRFDIVYGNIGVYTGSTVTVGAQASAGSPVVQFECNSGVLSSGLVLTFMFVSQCNLTPTPTPTNTPTGANVTIVGHVVWDRLPAQPNPLQQMPVTMTLKAGTTEVNFPIRLTDPSGFFSNTVTLENGTYNWRVKGNTYLASSGTLAVSSSGTIQVEMGSQKAGDLNADNVVSSQDFTTLKNNFGVGGTPPLQP